jgi:hypothetical protein
VSVRSHLQDYDGPEQRYCPDDSAVLRAPEPFHDWESHDKTLFRKLDELNDQVRKRNNALAARSQQQEQALSEAGKQSELW